MATRDAARAGGRDAGHRGGGMVTSSRRRAAMTARYDRPRKRPPRRARAGANILPVRANTRGDAGALGPGARSCPGARGHRHRQRDAGTRIWAATRRQQWFRTRNQPPREIVGVVGDEPGPRSTSRRVQDVRAALAQRRATESRSWERVRPGRCPAEPSARWTGAISVFASPRWKSVSQAAGVRARSPTILVVAFAGLGDRLARWHIRGALHLRQRTNEIGIRRAVGAQGRHIGGLPLAMGRWRSPAYDRPGWLATTFCRKPAWDKPVGPDHARRLGGAAARRRARGELVAGPLGDGRGPARGDALATP